MLVTLLLVPALLITGSGVDIARIYTARSIVQDANQMAANAALTQYDAMLQDLYGLFAISAEDDNLNQMVTDYVNLSLYGTKDTSQISSDTGAFALFSGSVSSTKVETQKSLGATKNTAELSELRHQIEEYAKFRAPVAIATEIIDRLKSFEQIKANADVIEDKLAIDGMVSDLQTLCKEVKKAIDDADKIKKEQENLIAELNALLDEVNRQFKQMETYRKKYEGVAAGSLFEDEEKEEYDRAYNTFLDNMSKLANGGKNLTIKKWVEGDSNDEGEWEYGKAETEKNYPRSFKDLTAAVADPQLRNKWSGWMDTMVNKCGQLDSKCESIKTECANLRRKLDSGECSPELAEEMKKQLEEYEKLALVKAEPMGAEVRQYNDERITKFIENFTGIVYGNLDQDNEPTAGNYLDTTTLDHLDSLPEFAINVVETNKGLQGNQKADDTKLGKMAGMKGYHYAYRYRYAKFNDSSVFGQDNKEFYELLKDIVKAEESSESEVTIDNIIKFLDKVRKKLEGLYKYTPQGAKYYKAADTEEGNEQFGQGGSWDDKDAVIEEMNGAMDKVDILVDGLDQVSRKVLLVAYGSEMFSCYTDPNTKEDAKAEKRITLSGIPMDTNVNYFYQSELEYLYNGNLGSAAANLLAVSGTILLIRFVFNYVATFTITSVQQTISTIKGTCSTIPVIGPALGVALGELARIAFALGESVWDLTDLRNGEPVPLTKNQETWQLSLVNFAKEVGEMIPPDGDNVLSGTETKTGWYYIDYLRIFLLLKDGNKLAERMEDLIELNVTNAKNKVYGKGEKIAGNEGKITGVDYFELDKQAISVKVATEVELRFLFFPLGYFQKGIDGAVAPTSMVLKAEDYRGY